MRSVAVGRTLGSTAQVAIHNACSPPQTSWASLPWLVPGCGFARSLMQSISGGTGSHLLPATFMMQASSLLR